MWQSIKNIYHLGVAFLANVWYGWPSKKLTVIGVTGTDGKTTTVHLIHHILKSAGKDISMISSIGAFIGGQEYPLGFHVTTPSPFALQRFIKQTLDARYLVLEVTSHALDQYRVWGVDFAVGVLTNVTHEHLDYHKTYENYVRTKAKLLEMAKVAVTNRDDDSFGIISNIKYQNSKIHSKKKKWVTYGLKNKADVMPKTFPFKMNLIGEFNRYNILAAIAACRTLGVDEGIMRKAIASFKLPIGRAEIVYSNSFSVMVDFAHTANAIEQILSSVKPTVSGRIIHVFGSAGKRDYAKRPHMGEASAKYADVIVLTAEDPRGEPVEKIMKEISSGIKDKGLMIKKGRLLKIPHREKAISAAIKMARRGDLVILTGKSHEKSMNYGRGEEPWDEYEAVKKALKERSKRRV